VKLEAQNASSVPDHDITADLCIQAAGASGAMTTDTFRIKDKWRYEQPKGCFKHECDESANGVCYFYNDNGDTNWPTAETNFTGTPICSRPKYQNGTENGEGGCPEGYMVIMHEDPCLKASSCLSENEPGPDNIIILDNKAQHPWGCFIAADGKVQFNGLVEGLGKTTPLSGTPVCIVNATLHFG